MKKRDASYYRNFSVMVRRRYVDADVMAHVLGLSHALRIAVMQGRDIETLSIVAVLRLCEPFRGADDLRRAYLRIAFLAYAMHDNAAARKATEEALGTHGGDARLRHILDVLQDAQETKKARGQY